MLDIDVSDRLLVHLLIPISILGGLGLSYLYNKFEEKEISAIFKTGFLISIFIIATLLALMTIENPNFPVLPKYDTKVTIGDENLSLPQIIPHTDTDVDLVKWFTINGNKNYTAISNNYYTLQFLSTNTLQPIATEITLVKWVVPGFYKPIVNSESSTYYFIYDKRLTLYSKNNPSIKVRGDTIFFNNNNSIQKKFFRINS